MGARCWSVLGCLVWAILHSLGATDESYHELMQQCRDGTFGYQCNFRCRCRGSEVCNKVTGDCASGCKDGYWGPGCQLSDTCFYNGQKRNYMGMLSSTKSLYTCQHWSEQHPHQHSYTVRDFPDRTFPDNFCRTTPDSNGPWCYTLDTRKRWEHCDIQNCNCPPGRYGHNCGKECHCRDPNEACDSILGRCQSGCALGWSGFGCNVVARCPDNRYGWHCNQQCHCRNPNDCDRFRGPQPGCQCKEGYFNPPNCELVTPPRILYFGNQQVNPGQPTDFNCTVAAFPTPEETEIRLIGPSSKRITLVRSQTLDIYRYTRYNIFRVNFIVPSERYTCLVQATAGTASMTIIGSVYELPRLNVPPQVVEGSITSHNVTIEWRKWNPERGDAGDAPVLWYGVYVRAQRETSYRQAGLVYHTFCDDKCKFTVPELLPNTEYAIYVVTRREGEGGEGPAGPVIHITTLCATPSQGPSVEEVNGDLQYNSSYPKTRILVKWNDSPKEFWNCDRISKYLLWLTTPGSETEGVTSMELPGGAANVLSLPNRLPATRYCVQLSYVTNGGYVSPRSAPQCATTPETVPSEPVNMSLRRATSSSVTFSWERPLQPNGNITLYRVTFWVAHATEANGVEWRSQDQRVEYTLTGLRPNTEYQIQVQAVNSAGVGDSSAILSAITDEGVPGPIQNLRNESRTTDSIMLAWDHPGDLNGKVKHYTVGCQAVRTLSSRAAEGGKQEFYVPAEKLTYAFNSLAPATKYRCSISAATNKGSGQISSIEVWTRAQDPPSPIAPVITDITDHTITIDLKDSGDPSISFYRVIVETIPQPGRSGRRRRSEVPQHIQQAKLGYEGARHTAYPAYVAAQLRRQQANGPFVVGDNHTYGGYYNAPLERDNSYSIWLGAYSVVDGTTLHSFSRTQSPVVARSMSAPPAANHVPVIIGVLIVFILLIVTLAVLLLVWRRRHLAAEREKAELPSFGPTIIPEPDTSPPPTPITNVEAEPLIEPCSTGELEVEMGASTPLAPIKVEDLWDYIRAAKDSDMEGLKKEYKLVPAGLIASCEVAKQNENKAKNRYGNIIAYDHTRVVLEPEDGDPTDDYINANYIDGYNKPRAYIAAQGPNKPTINDIWRMTWQENSKTIIMLTNPTETGKRKCEQYWPDEGCEKYGSLSVQLLDVDELPDFIIRTFLISKNDQSKYVKQFHYTTWPDHGVPKFGNSLLLFRQKIRAYDTLDNGPVIVHCSAGVGRTGTYISIDSQLERAKAEGIVDVHNFVQAMRTQRVNMVQTFEQYVFVYDCLLEALICGDTTLSSKAFPEVFRDMCQYDTDIGKTKLEEQFEILKLLSTTTDRDETTTALRPENIFKNRCKNIIPANRCRPYLMTPWEEGNDYINAVFINGYRQRDAYIVTQMPLPNTVVDFWRLIYDHNSYCIVMLNEIDAKDETCEQYWTLDTCGNTYGPFIVETTAEIKSDPSITIRDFTITNTLSPQETPRVVRQFHFHHWAEGGSTPSSKVALLELMDVVQRWQEQFPNRPVTVHCMNGACRSGLFCAVSCILERFKRDKEIDVFQAVKQLRLNRTQLIDNLEQYRFCHEIVLDFINALERPSTVSL